MSRLAIALALVSTIFAAGCAADPGNDADGDEASVGEDALTHRAKDAWFYDGPLPTLEGPQVTISLKGHTARVSGLLPAGAETPVMPHLKAKAEGARTRIDVVYPIATGEKAGYNAEAGTYKFTHARPWRPDGITISSSGRSYVTWGGFPFLAYAGNIALHGPISRGANASGVDVFTLRRGTVSHGCNRMLGEHVTEVAHLVGVNMRTVWTSDKIEYGPSKANARVNLVDDYDSYDGKLVDVDYPTDVGASRPPRDQTVMFGSWVGTETPDGSDLPADQKWEAGIPGKPYVFKNHAIPDMICSVPASRTEALRNFAKTLPGSVLPSGFCAKKKCILDTLKVGGDAKVACSL